MGLGRGLCELAELTPDEEDPLGDGDPREGGEEVDRPLEPAPGRDEQADPDQDDALDARAEPDVAAEPERLGRARV